MSTAQQIEIKRGPGRPKKSPAVIKRKPGRPRKELEVISSNGVAKTRKSKDDDLNFVVKYVKEKDYDKFSTIRGNRELEEKNIQMLMKAIQKEGNITAIVCHEEDGKYKVVDGQHRLEACRRLNIPVQALLVKDSLTAQQIAMLNSRQKRWNTLNYLKAKADTQHDVAASFLMSEVEALSSKLKVRFSPLCVWALLTGTETLTAQLKKDSPLELNKEAFHIYAKLKPKYVEIMKSVDIKTRITYKQAGFVQAIHDLILEPDFNVDEFIKLLKEGKRPALMNGARLKSENLKVIIQFYVNNTGKNDAFRSKLYQRLGLE